MKVTGHRLQWQKFHHGLEEEGKSQCARFCMSVVKCRTGPARPGMPRRGPRDPESWEPGDRLPGLPREHGRKHLFRL